MVQDVTTTLNTANLDSLPDRVQIPHYPRASLSRGIVHIGVGNFHRAHMAHYMDRLFSRGSSMDWAIVGAGVHPSDRLMRDRLQLQDWLTTVVDLDPNSYSARVTGSMIDFVPTDVSSLLDALLDPAIRLVSLTITEGGYFLDNATGAPDLHSAALVADAAAPGTPRTVFGVIVAALARRREAGIPSFSVLSCDNLPGNGDLTRELVVGLATRIDPDLAGWIEGNTAFPNSMVDCITPATSDKERALVREKYGIDDLAPVVCEPFRQWVVEDRFCAGRPSLEEVGVEFVPDVHPYELMKLRVLNAGHAAIAYAGALLGHHFVHDAMGDEDIRRWLQDLQSRESIPTLQPLTGVDYGAYLNAIIDRFSNPLIGDTIQRLAIDGSDRQPKFILPTVRAALNSDTPIDGLALEVALWCRYCGGRDESGRPIDVRDRRAGELQRLALKAIDRPVEFIENAAVFGDLSRSERFAGAFDRWFRLLTAHGVRSTLRSYSAGQDASPSN